MRASIIRMGNSHAIIIPKLLLEQCKIGSEVELEVEEGKIVIRPLSRPRQGWSEKFQLMAEEGDDQLLDAVAGEQAEWDKDEWEW